MLSVYGTGPTWLDIKVPLPPGCSDNQETFVAKIVVSVDITTENQWRFKSPPTETIFPLKLNEVTGATSLVYVGADVYCIGGEFGSNLPSKEVIKFNTSNPTCKLEWCPPMIKERAYPAVASFGAKLYVFGGLSPVEEETIPWAESLDTSMPIEDQKWEPLQEPIIRPCRVFGCTQLFIFPYDHQQIIIACSLQNNQHAIVYNVSNGTSSIYEFLPEIQPWGYARPVVHERTIYWIQNSQLMSFELDTKVSYRANLENKVFPEILFVEMHSVPLLVHLKDNLFGFFIVTGYDSETTKIIECHKVRVSEGRHGFLSLNVVGYQCYKCDEMHYLSGVVLESM